MPVVYTAVQRFDPACGERWHEFIEWSGLKQLREVVSLDLILCPTAFGELTDEDWRHNVQEDFKITLFHDLDHVLRRVAGGGPLQRPGEETFAPQQVPSVIVQARLPQKTAKLRQSKQADSETLQ